MIQLNVRQVGNYLATKIVVENATIDLSLLDKKGVSELLADCEEFTQDLRRYYESMK
jgi:hypothetical protein